MELKGRIRRFCQGVVGLQNWSHVLCLFFIFFIAGVLISPTALADDTDYLFDKVITWSDGTTEHVQIDSDGFFVIDGVKRHLIGMGLGTTGISGNFYDPTNLALFDKELTYLESVGIRLVHFNLYYVRWGGATEGDEEARYKALLDLVYQHKMLAVPLIAGKWFCDFDHLTNPDFTVRGDDTMGTWTARWAEIISQYSNVVAVAAENEIDCPIKATELSWCSNPQDQQYTTSAVSTYMEFLTDTIKSQINVPVMTKLMDYFDWTAWPHGKVELIKEAAIPYSDLSCWDVYQETAAETGTKIDEIKTWLEERGYPTEGWWIAEFNADGPDSGLQVTTANFNSNFIETAFDKGVAVVFLFVGHREQELTAAFFDANGNPTPKLVEIAADFDSLQAPIDDGYLFDRVITWGDGTTEHVQIDSDGFFVLNGTKRRLVGMMFGSYWLPYGQPGQSYLPENLAYYDTILQQLQSAGIRVVSMPIPYWRQYDWFATDAEEINAIKSFMNAFYQRKMLIIPYISTNDLDGFGDLSNPDFNMGSSAIPDDTVGAWAGRLTQALADSPSVVGIALENELDALEPPAFTTNNLINYMNFLKDIFAPLNIPFYARLVGSSWGSDSTKQMLLGVSDIGAFHCYDPSPASLDARLVNLENFLQQIGFTLNNGWWSTEVSYRGTDNIVQASGFTAEYIETLFNHGATLAVMFAANHKTKPNWAFFDDNGNPIQSFTNAATEFDRLQAPIEAPLSISFIPPTPDDGATVNRDYTEVNVSVSNAESAFIDWNRSLVGYWDFNENSGTTANDKSTYSNDGTLNGPLWTSGKYGSALNFDGVDDYVDYVSDASLYPAQEMSLEFWLKRGTHTNDYVVAIYLDGNNFVYFHNPDDGNWITLSITLLNAGQSWLSWGYAPPLNEWHHYFVTFNGTDIKQYLDGVLKRTTNKPNDEINFTKNYFRIGSGAWWGYFNGTIDEVRIWNRALSPEEIKSSYNSGMYRLSHKFTNLADGTYQYYAYAIDIEGNSARTETRSLTIKTVTLSNRSDQLNQVITNGPRVTVAIPLIYHDSGLKSITIEKSWHNMTNIRINESGTIRTVAETDNQISWLANLSKTAYLLFEVPSPRIIMNIETKHNETFYQKDLIISSENSFRNVSASIEISSSYENWRLYWFDSEWKDVTSKFNLRITNSTASFYGFNTSDQLFRIEGSTEDCIDADGDGYYSPVNCSVGNDCDDANAAVHPGAGEICGTGVDEDCDGLDASCPSPPPPSGGGSSGGGYEPGTVNVSDVTVENVTEEIPEIEPEPTITEKGEIFLQIIAPDSVESGETYNATVLLNSDRLLYNLILRIAGLEEVVFLNKAVEKRITYTLTAPEASGSFNLVANITDGTTTNDVKTIKLDYKPLFLYVNTTRIDDILQLELTVKVYEEPSTTEIEITRDHTNVYIDYISGKKMYKANLTLMKPGEYKILARTRTAFTVVDEDVRYVTVPGIPEIDYGMIMIMMIIIIISLILLRSRLFKKPQLY